MLLCGWVLHRLGLIQCLLVFKGCVFFKTLAPYDCSNRCLLLLLLLWLLQVPDLLRDFVVCGALPSASALQDAAVVPTLLLGEAMQHLKEAATAANAATAAAASSRVAGDGSSSSQSGAGGGSHGISSQSENGF